MFLVQHVYNDTLTHLNQADPFVGLSTVSIFREGSTVSTSWLRVLKNSRTKTRTMLSTKSRKPLGKLP